MTLPHAQALHTTEQAAAALDLPPGLIRKWAHRGRIAVADHLPALTPGRRGHPLYNLAELQPLAERYHSRKTR